MNASVEFTPEVRKQIANIPQDVYENIKKRMCLIAADPKCHPPGVDIQCMYKGQNCYRLRVGGYRVEYEVEFKIERNEILVTWVGTRGDAYKK